MENTIIIKSNGQGINANKCCTYRLSIRMTERAGQRKSDTTRYSTPDPCMVELLADTFEGGIEFISKFDTPDAACMALLSLFKAIGDSEKMWDVRDYHSSQESDNGDKIESSDKGQNLVEGTIIPPSTCE